MLEAIEKLPQRDNVALIVIGDGPLKGQVIKRGVETLGSRFLFQGFVNQSKLGKFYQAADALVFPSSISETWGLVANEAMQFERPIILSDMVGCHRDLIADHDTGIVFKSGDSDSLAQALGKLASSPDTARRMGRNAYRRVQKYSIEESAQGILEAILQ